MKKRYTIFIVFLLIKTASAQVLLEDKDGDKIVNNNILLSQVSRLSLIKLNTGDQSLGFSYFTSTSLHNPEKYNVQEFGLKASPTAGYAAVFRSGQFSPGIKANYGLTLVNLFNRPIMQKKIMDWLSFDLGYNFDNYLLYQQNAAFANQLYYKTSKTYQAFVGYNLLLKSKYIINIKAGYSRKNNYADLSSVEVNDITSVTNTTTGTVRQVSNSSTAGEGNYLEYNSFPQIISFTRATKTDDPNSDDAKMLRLGYTLFAKNQFSSYLNKTDAGVIFFLSKQDKTSGIRNPVLGLVIQAVNLFDTQQLNNGLQNRIRIGFTTNFSL